MQVEGRQHGAFGDDLDAVELREQRHQFRLNLANDVRGGILEQRRIADELQRIAKPLLGMQQDGLAGKRRVAEPQRLTKGAPLVGKRAGFPAPLIGLPAGLEIAERQVSKPCFEMGLGKVGTLLKRRIEASKRLLWPVEPAQRMTAIGQDLRMVRHQRERVVVARERIRRPVEPQ